MRSHYNFKLVCGLLFVSVSGCALHVETIRVSKKVMYRYVHVHEETATRNVRTQAVSTDRTYVPTVGLW